VPPISASGIPGETEHGSDNNEPSTSKVVPQPAEPRMSDFISNSERTMR